MQRKLILAHHLLIFFAFSLGKRALMYLIFIRSKRQVDEMQK